MKQKYYTGVLQMLTVIRIARRIPRRRRRRSVARREPITEDDVLEKEYFILVELGVPA